MPWLREIPETVYWRARFCKHAVLGMSGFMLPLENRREDRPSIIGCHDGNGHIKKKPKLLDWEYAAVECETVDQICQHNSPSQLVTHV